MNENIIPNGNEWYAVHNNWKYPFRNYKTAEEFLNDISTGYWTEEMLNSYKFERYPVCPNA